MNSNEKNGAVILVSIMQFDDEFQEETSKSLIAKFHKEIADGLKRAGKEVFFHALESVQGHDAFLVDKERFAPVVADFFGNHH